MSKMRRLETSPIRRELLVGAVKQLTGTRFKKKLLSKKTVAGRKRRKETATKLKQLKKTNPQKIKSDIGRVRRGEFLDPLVKTSRF